MNVMIIGCTKVGITLASDLLRNGHEVSIIDEDGKRFCDLPTFFKGVTVEGTPMDVSVLEKAGIVACDAVAAVSDDDNLNIVVSQIARDMFRIPTVVARVEDPVRERVYEKMGLKTICPTNIEGAGIYNMITGENYDSLVSFGNKKARFSTRFDKKWVGRMLCDIPLFDGEIIYAVVDIDGELSLADDRSRELQDGEKIIVTSLVD